MAPTRRGIAAKVDGRMVHQIKELRAQGLTQAAIGVEVGITQGTVSNVLRQYGLAGPLMKIRKMRDYPS